MFDFAAPRCEAWISPELVQLLRGQGTVAPACEDEDTSAADCIAPTAVPDEPIEEPVPAVADMSGAEMPGVDTPGLDWPEVALRVDGRRPMRFRGLLLFRAERRLNDARGDRHAAFVQDLKLFLADSMEVIAHAICTPAEGFPGRPLYRVAHIGNAGDIARLLEGSGPIACFDMVAALSPAAMPTLTDKTARLPGLTLP